MSEQVLGYIKEGDKWEAIHECKRGYVYTCAFILCSQCNKPVRSMGGPNNNAWCIGCKENFEKGVDKE